MISFEETYKTAYSHGLENIYAIQNIDLKTVRRIQKSNTDSLVEPERTSIQKTDNTSSAEQLELNLGDTFRGWIEPFVLREPIQVLGLTRHAELCLIEHKIVLLRDLVNQDLDKLVFLKGMGQGHIDEIQNSLQAYLGNRSLERSVRVEFGSWVKSICAGLDRKKAAVFLQSYGLEDLLLLSKAEEVEVKHLDPEIQNTWKKEFFMTLRAEGRLEKVHEDMSRIVNVFIVPWMRARLYKATVDELMERLEKISDCQERAHRALCFFSEVYYDKKFPFAKYLYTIEENLYGCDKEYVLAYHEIVNKAQTYFYQRHIHYTMTHLVGLLARDFAREWKSFSDDLIEAALCTTSRFQFCKGPSGTLEIWLA